MSAPKHVHDEIERFDHAGMTVVICSDPDAQSPRDNDGNLCHIVHWHRDNVCGDEDLSKERREGTFSSAGEVRDYLVQRAKDAGDEILAILPVWIYQHSGITLRAAEGRPGYPFSCQWDAGQVGFAYVLRSTAVEVGCIPGKKFPITEQKKDADGKFTPEHVVTGEGTYDEAFFKKAIVSEVELFDLWANGGFTGYIVFDAQGDNVDSCWGFDDADYCKVEARSAAEHCAEDEKEARKKFTKAAWKRAVSKGETEDGYEDWLKAQRAQKGAAA